MPKNISSVNLKVLRVQQPIGEFYIGSIDSDELLHLSTVDVRRFEDGNPDKIGGIQRQLSKSRIKDLKEYVNLDYATFPTSIIIAMDERSVRIEPIQNCCGLYDFTVVEFKDDNESIPLDRSAFIIDGQHRLAGLEALKEDKKPFFVNVSIFVGADLADQAEIFSRVNLAQTKVNKSLMYDLLDYAKENSPFKAAHDITIALNNDKNGPFYRKIKRLGVQTLDLTGETLAQATVVDGILRHLPPNQDKERQKGFFHLIGMAEPHEKWTDRIFIDYYRKNDLVSILQIMTNYFSAVQRRWPQAWDKPENGQILCRTNGYNALIRFLKDAYLSLIKEPRIVTIDEFATIFSRIDYLDKEFNTDNFKPGSAGSGLLYRNLKSKAGL